MIQTAEIRFGDERLILDPRRAVYWPAQRALIVADMHLGKPQVFRDHGHPVPDGSDTHDLHKLSALLNAYAGQTLYVLGDLVHRRPGMHRRWFEQFLAWVEKIRPIEVVLILGNHDRGLASLLADSPVHAVPDALSVGAITLRHEPEESTEAYIMAGHLHPGIKLRDGKTRLRLPTFRLREHSMVLPAFGSFTGLATVEPLRDERVFVCGEDAVVEIRTRSSSQMRQAR